MLFMSLLSVLKAGIEFKRNFAKNNTDCERAGTLLECQGGLSFSLWSVESYILDALQRGDLKIEQSMQSLQTLESHPVMTILIMWN